MSATSYHIFLYTYTGDSSDTLMCSALQVSLLTRRNSLAHGGEFRPKTRTFILYNVYQKSFSRELSGFCEIFFHLHNLPNGRVWAVVMHYYNHISTTTESLV